MSGAFEWSDAVGWFTGLVLLATISRQVYTQWKTRSTTGVSHWLFVGQLVASAGFLVYSLMLDNRVFVATNALMVAAAIAGQVIYRHNLRRDSAGTAA